MKQTIGTGAAGGTGALIFNWAWGIVFPEVPMPAEVGAAIAVAVIVPSWHYMTRVADAAGERVLDLIGKQQ